MLREPEPETTTTADLATAAATTASPTQAGPATLTEEAVRAMVEAELAKTQLQPSTIAELVRVQLVEQIPPLLEKMKAAMLDELVPTLEGMARALAPASAAAATLEGMAKTVPAELAVEDPVKVWADPEHKTFRTGEIVALHDAGHAFDVKLDDGTVTKIGADGLEYDNRR